MNYAPLRGEYKEVICFKNISIIHIDWGNIEVFEGQSYRECLSGFGHLRENICKDDCVLIEIDGYLCPFDKKHFGTLREWREKKLKDLGI
jgi:hypothetical protein